MKKNKIGTIFLVSILALAGIGVSYSGFSDIITIHGSVNTGTVTFDVADYSGTDVWKIHKQGENDVNIIWHGFISDPDRPTKESLELLYPGYTADLIASSWAKQGTEYDVDMVWDNISPCTDFIADIIVHYTGSIPAKVSVGTFIWDVTGYDFSPYTTVKYYWYTKDNGEWVKGEEITTIPVQMHNCHYIGIEVTIHLEQLDGLQGVSGAFSFDINAVQWNDDCNGGTAPAGTIHVYKITIPEGGSGFGFTVTGPDGYSYMGTLAHGEHFTLENLNAGTYTITETLPEDWTLEDIELVGDYTSEVYSDNSVTFYLIEAGEVHATFNNTFFQEGQEETAWCGNYAVNVGGPGQWFYYYQNGEQYIWAGQYTKVGTVFIQPSVTPGFKTITLTLYDGVQLVLDGETVSVEGYYEAPTNAPIPGLMEHQFTSLIFDVPEGDPAYPIWAIHLVVEGV